METETEAEIVQTLAGHKLICTDTEKSVATDSAGFHGWWHGCRETPASEIQLKCNMPLT